MFVDVRTPRETAAMPQGIMEAASRRHTARAHHDYITADALHKQIKEAGYKCVADLSIVACTSLYSNSYLENRSLALALFFIWSDTKFTLSTICVENFFRLSDVVLPKRKRGRLVYHYILMALSSISSGVLVVTNLQDFGCACRVFNAKDGNGEVLAKKYRIRLRYATSGHSFLMVVPEKGFLGYKRLFLVCVFCNLCCSHLA